MTVQLVIHSTGGEIVGKWQNLTDREVVRMRQAMNTLFADGKTPGLELDTEEGWVVVPGSQVLYLEVKVGD